MEPVDARSALGFEGGITKCKRILALLIAGILSNGVLLPLDLAAAGNSTISAAAGEPSSQDNLRSRLCQSEWLQP